MEKWSNSPKEFYNELMQAKQESKQIEPYKVTPQVHIGYGWTPTHSEPCFKIILSFSWGK